MDPTCTIRRFDRLKTPAFRRQATLFCLSAVLLVVVQFAVAYSDFSARILLQQVLYPALIVVPLCFALSAMGPSHTILANISPYALFFSITLLSVLNVTKPIDGAFATSSILLIYGLPFYTATLAVWIKRDGFSGHSPLIAASPLLLITGPIPVRFIFHSSSFARRFTYFGPFMIVGFFFFKVVASPLAYCQQLIELTDPLSAVMFAMMFELFVYFNFAGLSLLVYGALGILGVRVPLNFRQPFTSRNLVEFWRGWHTSLSGVLKCLFYAPVKAHLGTYTAVMTVFLASAAWHGMMWNFLLWGLLHGVGYVVTLALLRSGKRGLTTLILFATIVLGRLVFADTDTDRLIEKLLPSLTAPDFSKLASAPKAFYISLVLAVALVGVEFIGQRNSWVARRSYKHLRAWIPLAVIVFLIVLLTENTGLEYAVYGQR
ncbi:MAG: hypothetical protein ACJAZ1_003567 [Yoonia sp.]|jgi:alginate O-acetyltransferase complex protein AlgI